MGLLTDLLGDGNGTSGVIGVASYNPGTLASYTTASTSASDVDATNLAVTFTAPASGNIHVQMSSWGKLSNGAAMYYGLRSGSGVVANTTVAVSRSNNIPERIIGNSVVTGLTPGASYTYKWAWLVDAGSTGTLYMGGGFGPGVLTIDALPA